MTALSDLASWWLQQLRSLLPAPPPPGREDAVLLRPNGQGLDLWQRRRGSLRRLRGRPPGRTRAGLELPPDSLLVRPVELPLAAEAVLEPVLRGEMDRLTPFAAEEIVWSYRVLGRNRATGLLGIELALAPRAVTEALLAQAAAIGVRPAWLEGAGPDGEVRRIGLAPTRSATVERGRVRVAAALCVILGTAAAAIPFVQQQRQLSALEARIAAAKPGADTAAKLRAELSTSANGAAVLAAEQARAGDTLGALASLTEALPDDTFVTDLTMHERVLTVGGRSGGAVRLIGLLAGAPGLANPAFTSPVLRMSGDHPDQFTLRVEMAR